MIYRLIVFFLLVSGIVSCTRKAGSKFSVNGVLTNTTARMIYLEEVPAIGMQPVIVDSALIGKDGAFSLEATPAEEVVFNLLLDQGDGYPVVSVINDVAALSLNIKVSPGNKGFSEAYDVKGSPASQQWKDYFITTTRDLKKLYVNIEHTDSLRRVGTPDSILQPLMAEKQAIVSDMKKYTEQALAQANSPALVLMELGFYQSAALRPPYELESLSNEQVSMTLFRAAQRFPSHDGIAAVNADMQKQMQDFREMEERKKANSLVGRPAPDFSLPDVNGNPVKLSSFRGKYVLVDFWASWCGPCRMENPNVVNTYRQFRDKNFTVLGVSLDKPGQKDKWLKAIKDDNLEWTHVSDLREWSSAVIPLYRITGIPFNVLVDPNGNVIAEDLKGAKLRTRLAEVLQ